ncbi:Txe/YoeB family addiction module toxin [Pseudaminobacter sp. 19-2017]|uniref:Putative mRNA interferase YoeB n=1 Tax=Pseudaminobacter soli (ex Zhang et al. 2022) TaxID=2831468 RepID=A0A942DW42_9HYPH|nr:Txe/YoeB family addiction module toxin [Pseudaminobacter soli]
MRIIFSSRSWTDYTHWQAADPAIAARINELIKEISRHPFVGIGRPEPLRSELSGWWSRRIDHEHRLVYRVTGKGDQQAIEISACRLHYRK